MVIKILRMLDPASLLSCALVSKSWLSYVHDDPELRSRVRQHLRRLKQQRARPLNIRFRMVREGREAVPFCTSNGRFKIKTIPTQTGDLRTEIHAPIVISKGKMSSLGKTLRKARIATYSAMPRILGLPVAMESKFPQPSHEIGSYNGMSAMRSSSKCVKPMRI
ncbi:uncharacterized protein LOC124171630 [Ischnura elegans]|uniref:uncharacterized protein LOC124171630 n=1 Tax=Ischnura elegans TaxID=197161 RepID=UPI001ED8BFC3|nr:uncharacterized protein LOC124171630 [Ischnura elegans]